MKAHYVLAQTSCSIRLCQDGIEVFYYSQTISSQSQVICCTPGTCITEIKCLLAVERRSWVSIWNSHLAQAESVQNVPSIISDIMEDRSFAGGETDPEPPFLPLLQVPINLKRETILLNNVQCLDVCSKRLRKKLRNILRWGAVIEDILLVSAIGKPIFSPTSSQLIYSHNLTAVRVHNRDDWQGVSIMI
jgi:hypothetical protein